MTADGMRVLSYFGFRSRRSGARLRRGLRNVVAGFPPTKASLFVNDILLLFESILHCGELSCEETSCVLAPMLSRTLSPEYSL